MPLTMATSGEINIVKRIQEGMKPNVFWRASALWKVNRCR